MTKPPRTYVCIILTFTKERKGQRTDLPKKSALINSLSGPEAHMFNLY